jgi:hypothetical protein
VLDVPDARDVLVAEEPAATVGPVREDQTLVLVLAHGGHGQADALREHTDRDDRVFRWGPGFVG